jgi:MFS family permease
VALLLFATGWGTNQFVALLPLYRTALGLSEEQAASLFGVYALTVVPGLIGGGPISDRRGRRPTAITAASIALVGTWLPTAACVGAQRWSVSPTR